MIPVTPDAATYYPMRQRAEAIFWRKFAELKPRYQNIDMGKLRDIAQEMLDEYIKFIELKMSLRDSYKNRRMDNEYSDSEGTIERASQAGMAFALYRLMGRENFSVSAVCSNKDYHYHGNHEDCMNLGFETAKVVFGSLAIRLLHSVYPAYGEDILINSFILKYKENRPQPNNLVKMELIFESDPAIVSRA